MSMSSVFVWCDGSIAPEFGRRSLRFRYQFLNAPYGHLKNFLSWLYSPATA